MYKYLLSGILMAVLAGCGAPPQSAMTATSDAPVQAQGRGKIIGKAMHVGIGPGMPGERPELLAIGLEIDTLFFNKRPGSAQVDIRVGGKVAASGLLYPAKDGRLYLGNYNSDNWYLVGTHYSKEQGRTKHGTKIPLRFYTDMDYYYKHEGGVMGSTTFYLIADKAPVKVSKQPELYPIER